MNNGAETRKPGRQSGDEIELGLFFRELFGHWHYFVISFLALILLAFLYWRLTLPVYRATSSVLVKVESGSASRNIDNILTGDIFGSSESVATEMGVLVSRTVLNETIEALELEISYFNESSFPSRPLYRNTPFRVEFDTAHSSLYDVPFKVEFLDNGKYELSVKADDRELEDYEFSQTLQLGQKVKTPHFTLQIDETDTFDDKEHDKFSFVLNSRNKHVNWLRSNLKVETLNKDASILVLTFDDTKQQRALDILNEIGRSYIRLDIRDKTTVASLTLQFVEQQLSGTSKQLEDIEQELQDFKEQNKTVDLSTESRVLLDRINQIETQRTKAEIELETLDNLLEYVTERQDMTQLAPSSLGIPDPLLVELIEHYQQLQSKRKSISYGIKSNAPALRILDQQITDTRESLVENIKSIRKNITIESKALTVHLKEFESGISRIPATERELLDIQRRAEVNQNIYLYLLQKQAETSIAKATVISDNKVLDEAVLQEEPVLPNLKLLAILVLFSGVVLPVVILALKKAFKTTISHRDEITKLTNIPILGVVGHLHKSDNLAVIHKPKSAIAESFRSIRANLQFMGTLERRNAFWSPHRWEVKASRSCPLTSRPSSPCRITRWWWWAWICGSRSYSRISGFRTTRVSVIT